MEKKTKKCHCNNDECNCECNCGCNEEHSCECNKNEIDDLQDKYLRLQAEYINFKNRTSMEVTNMLKFEGENLIKELLPIVDNFERAILLNDSDVSSDVSRFLSGFKMIYGNLKSVLDEYEVKEIPAEGLEFDPNVMDAVLSEHDEDKPANVVLEVLTKGYTYKGKVIRPAMVKVNN